MTYLLYCFTAQPVPPSGLRLRRKGSRVKYYFFCRWEYGKRK